MNDVKQLIKAQLAEIDDLSMLASYFVFSDVIEAIAGKLTDNQYQNIVDNSDMNMWANEDDYPEFVSEYTAEQISVVLDEIDVDEHPNLIIAINPDNPKQFEILNYQQAIDYFVDGEGAIWH